VNFLPCIAVVNRERKKMENIEGNNHLLGHSKSPVTTFDITATVESSSPYPIASPENLP